MRDLRYRAVVEQSDWFTCGPAAAATLLSRYFGLNVSEARVVELAVAFMNLDPGRAGPPSGITLKALSQAMEVLGVPSSGYRVSLEALAGYFRRGGLPVILHVSRPRPHFVVGVGYVAGQMVADDPWWGREVVPLAEWAQARGYEGITLVPRAPADLARLASRRQLQELNEVVGRRRRLRALGAAGP